MRRLVAFRIGNWTSEPTSICTGLSHDSPLTLVLYNIYTAIMAQIVSRGPGVILTFVDDILIYVNASDEDTQCTCVFQTIINRVYFK